MSDNDQIWRPSRLALLNGRILLPDRIVEDKALIIEGKQIAGIDILGTLGEDCELLDVGGRLITPGLIDIHTHGAVGYNFNEATEAAFAAITAQHVQRGITAVLATTVTAPIHELVKCLNFSREWMARPQPDAQILGVHLEGPYFCAEQRGAQSLNFLRNPDDGTPEALLAHADVVRIFTYAPELPGAIALTRRLAELDIVAAAGHSCARADDVAQAMELGLSHIIHIWSGQSTTIRQGPWRSPGLLEATLAFDGLTVEMIADNCHLPATLMKLAYKCIGPDRLCAISDATSGAGLPERTPFQVGDVDCIVRNGVGMLPDESQFAGSTTFLNQMVPVLTEVACIPLVEAVRMVTLTPARIIGVDKKKGSLEAGKDADLTIFEDDFSAWRTMIGGNWVYMSS